MLYGHDGFTFFFIFRQKICWISHITNNAIKIVNKIWGVLTLVKYVLKFSEESLDPWSYKSKNKNLSSFKASKVFSGRPSIMSLLDGGVKYFVTTQLKRYG